MHRVSLLLLTSCALMAQSEREWLNRGVQVFKEARYAEAVAAFERAVESNPGSVAAHLYLGTAHMAQYVPGSAAPEMAAHADRAAAEFQRVLDIEQGNQTALNSIASLELNRKRFAEARSWYRRLAEVNPQDRNAYYSIAFSIWSEWYPAYGSARAQLGMRQDTPGPIGDAATRERLRAEWWTRIDEAIANLKRALEIDPEYSDAMAYLNLFIRERADLLPVGEYQAAIAEADQWVQRALDAKKKEASGTRRQFGTAPPPPPPPPPPAPSGGSAARIVVGGDVQESKLVRKVDPIYPALAKEAQIQGTVKLEIVIGKDGNVVNAQVNSGHPLLIPAALDAVKQWQYRQTLLNGDPVEVRTAVDIHFTLAN